LVRHTAHDANARRDFVQQLDRASQGAYCVGRVLRFFKADRGVGTQLQRRRRLANRGSLEVGAFEHHSRCLVTDGGGRAADHTGQRDSAGSVGDHQVARVEQVVFAVQTAEPLGRIRGADEDGIAGKLVGIESVRRLG